MRTNDIIEALDRLHDCLLIDGWARGTLHDEHGSHCLLGALCVIDNSHGQARAAMQVLAFIIEPEAHISEWPTSTIIMAWNDEPGRTIDDVLDLIRYTQKQLAT